MKASLTGNRMVWGHKHNKILAMVSANIPRDKIAQEVGISERQIIRITQTKEFIERAAIASKETSKAIAKEVVKKALTSQVRTKLDAASEKAVDIIIEIATKKPRKLTPQELSLRRMRFEASKDILDRSGYKAVDVVETRERSYTPEELERAGRTMLELEGIEKRLFNHDSRFVLNSVVKEEVPVEESSVPDLSSTIIQEKEPSTSSEAET